MSWPDTLEYPTEVVEAVATFIHLDDGPVPHVVKQWAKTALADVSDAAAQTPLFGEARTVVDSDWQTVPPTESEHEARHRAVMDAAAAKGDTSEMRREYEGKNL